MKKRQEIGRGLRLPVNQDGERVFDEQVNVLTVIPNESYESFARALQTEIEEDCGVSFTGRIKRAKDRKQVRLRKGYELDPNFRELWERIRQKTRYQVRYESEALIAAAAKALSQQQIVKPKITNVKVRVVIDCVSAHSCGVIGRPLIMTLHAASAPDGIRLANVIRIRNTPAIVCLPQ